MKLLVVLFLIGCMNASQASTSSKKTVMYSFEINDNTLCDIVLLNDKEYLIDLIYTFPEGRLSGHEEVNHTILSYGNYNTQSNVVTFKDAVSEYRLCAVRKESFIEITEGFPFILNKKGDLSVWVDNHELLTESLEHYKNHVSTYQTVLQQKEKSPTLSLSRRMTLSSEIRRESIIHWSMHLADRSYTFHRPVRIISIRWISIWIIPMMTIHLE